MSGSSSLAVLCALVAAAGAQEAFDVRSPVRVLPPGQRVEVQADGGFRAAAGHAYRLMLPIDGGRNEDVRAAVRLGTTELLFWPQWHEPAALRPADELVGYAIVPPALAGPVAIALQVPDAVTVGPARVMDLGVLADDPPAVLWRADFARWIEPNRPAGFGSVAFAEPGQFIPAEAGAHNRAGRLMLFGDSVPCRFGDLLRFAVRARGPGLVRLALTPYLADRRRGLPATWAEAAPGDNWQTVELVVGQHLVEADGVRATIECRGDTTLGDARVERLATPARVEAP